MFSIGMATYDDFDGVYFTVMSLLAHHGEHVGEVIIIDNNPSGPVSKSLQEFVANGDRRVRYVPYDAATGTSQPRNEVFKQARFPRVVCVDSHVMLLPGALAALADQYADNPENPNLFQGPLVMDNMVGLATHFDDVWSSEMWGTWGFDERVDTQPVFDIPAQGLGVFACHRDAWLGFNPAFRGFGGEEWYIHEKYRRAGRRTLCVSGFRWVHRFGRPRGVPYPLDRYNKVRNYALGLQELGIDLTRCHNHFVNVQKFPQEQWDAAVRGDASPPAADAKPGCGSCSAATYEKLAATPSDINEHMPTLAELATSRVVVDCGTRNESSVALKRTAAGYSKRDSLTGPATPCDLVFLDSEHTADHVYRELTHWHTRALRAAIHDSVSFPDVMVAVRRFVREFPEWQVVRHDRNNNGLVVLSKVEADRKPLPSTLRQASNFLTALAAHVVSGEGEVEKPRYELRLAACDVCPSRNGERCGECGCPVAAKAKKASQECPLGYWP